MKSPRNRKQTGINGCPLHHDPMKHGCTVKVVAIHNPLGRSVLQSISFNHPQQVRPNTTSPCRLIQLMIEMTYSWQLDATVSALRRSSSLLDVKVSKFSAGGLDNADLVRSGVVSASHISPGPFSSNQSCLLTGCDVCTSVCWNPSCRLGVSLKSKVDVVVVVVVDLKFRKFASPRKVSVWES